MRVWLRLVCLLVVTIIGSIQTNIGALLRPKIERLAYRMRRQGVAARRACRIFNIHVKVSEDARIALSTLRVSNHLTVMDPIILASQLDVCFAGKAEIARWPIIGWICKCYAMLLVDRRHRGKVKTFASQIRERLQKRGSVLVFPEGTTGNGKTLLPFKTGAFESIRDWNQGRLQPIFINVVGVNGRIIQGDEGRIAISQGSDGKHRTFIEDTLHMAGFRRLDIELRIGPFLNISGMDRRAISEAARGAIMALSGNNPPCTE
ncbi:MAG: lysophospholipid acyltransferase family protein [Bacteroidetes bacterium]|nr:lysophospholipid acyltransferase family protein [Bacteroidota bacterium]